MTINDNAAAKKIANYVSSNYELIKVKSGKCRYNYKCQMNAVHEAKKYKHKKLAMCVYLEDDGCPIIHFINYNKGKFIDNTLGQWSKTNTYYFIKWVKDEEMWDINDIFTDYREHLGNQLSWWIRLTSEYRG